MRQYLAAHPDTYQVAAATCGVRLVGYLGRRAALLVSSTSQVASSWILMLDFCDVETSRVKACSSVRHSRCIKIPLAIPMLSRELRAVCHSVCWADPISAIAACAANSSPTNSASASNASSFEE